MSKPHVLIMGAGLGGIALAQSLRKYQIPFSIFERDAADDTRFLSDIKKATLDDLPSLKSVCTTYYLGLDSEFAMYKADTGVETKRIQSSPNNYFIRAGRAKLRQWLLTKLDVKWGKKFAHYTQDADGITAFFEDGSSAKGDVLVGADGIGSRVRTQLLGENGPRPQYVPMGVVVGQLTATEDQYCSWIKNGTSFYVGSVETTRIFIGLKSISEDKKSAVYYCIFNWKDAASNPDYWTANASQEELCSYVLSQITKLSPMFTEPIRSTPVSELPGGRVTLLGDAVHPMSPFQGQGGNMAMKDAFMLADVLAEMETGK